MKRPLNPDDWVTVSTDEALREFLDAWSAEPMLDLLGPHLTCREANTLMDLLHATGHTEAAQTLHASHASADLPDDGHYPFPWVMPA